MAKKEELQDPTFVPYEGELRFLIREGDIRSGGEANLQQYQSRHGWHDVPYLSQSEIPVGHGPNARNS